MFKEPIYEAYLDSWWLEDILEDFSKETVNPESCYYKERIAYSQWQELKNIVKANVDLTFRSDLKGWLEIFGPDQDLLWIIARDKEDNTGPFLDYVIHWIGYNLDRRIHWTQVKKEEFNEMSINPLTGTIKYSATASSSAIANYGSINCNNDDYDNNKNINKEENKIMSMFNFNFGPVNDKAVRVSVYGLALKNKTGNYVSYNPKEDAIVDVDVFNFGGASNFLYKMPVAIKDIKVGDVVLHNNVPMFVVGIEDDGKSIVAVDPVAGERKTIMLTRSPFGFDFATKIVNFIEGAFGDMNVNADNPFGNIWMLMAMNGEGGSTNIKDMLPMMMFAQGGNIDPMMAMLLMNDNKSSDILLPLMFAMQNTKPATKCDCKCGEHTN